MTQKKHIAVLGGGIGSLSAVFELTAIPNWKDRFDITVYQMGWQLGGKGASGRRADKFQRNEEHGLHVWLGFYDNALDLVDRCYRELDPNAGHGWNSWRDAFRPLDKFVLYDQVRQEPVGYQLPAKSGLPGKRPQRSFVFWHFAVEMAQFLAASYERATEREGQGGPQAARADHLIDATDKKTPSKATEDNGAADTSSERTNEDEPSQSRAADSKAPPSIKARRGLETARLNTSIEQLARRFSSMPRDTRLHTEEQYRLLVEETELVVDLLRSLDRPRYWELLEIGLAMLRGMIVDRVITRGFGEIEHLDWREWLDGHGAHRDALASAPARASYDLVFGYKDGDPISPSVGAGTGTHCLLRMLLDYRESVAYELVAGMGEAVFTPLYLVLRDRGVRFKFFHRVDKIRLSADRQFVESIELTRQAKTKNGNPYQPLVPVKSLLCWPALPLFDQLENGDALENAGFSMPDDDGLGETLVPLQRGTDFDEVILGIPLPGLESIAAELRAASTDWAEMFTHIASTATMGVQLWLNSDTNQLGWPDNRTLFGAFQKPFDTIWDADSVIQFEDYNIAPPKSAMYLCTSYPESVVQSSRAAGGSPENAARDKTADWIVAHGTTLWKNLPRRRGFDWNRLYDPTNAAGKARLDWQHVSANVKGWQRYVQSLPNTAQYRLRSDQSGFDNLYLAGDWTKTAINAGCMEAAVMSGLRSARAISGEPIEISGEDEQMGGPPRPVDEIRRRIAKLDDARGTVDAVGVILALPIGRVRAMLPRGLQLVPVPNMPADTHPVGVLFCRHWDVRPAIAPAILGASYNELAFALPYVRPTTRGGDGLYTVLPLLMLDSVLAAGGGVFLGFQKKIARLSVNANSRRAMSTFRARPLLDFESTVTGAAKPGHTIPNFALADQVFKQPVLVSHLGRWREVGMDFGLARASIVPLSGRLAIHRAFLNGLDAAEHAMPSIDSSPFGAFGFTSDWYLDAGLLPNR